MASNEENKRHLKRWREAMEKHGPIDMRVLTAPPEIKPLPDSPRKKKRVDKR